MSGSSFRPHFVGVGTASAGTTWLHDRLAAHPSICMPRTKELFYFCHDPLWGTSSNHSLGPAWLERQFSHRRPDQITGEISPTYLSDPASANLIKEGAPGAKIIVSFRQPVDRLYSMYHMLSRLYPLPDTFEEFLDADPRYLASSRYATLLDPFLAAFTKEQFFFVIFDDIKNRPEELLRDLYAFLGVDPSFVPEGADEAVNPHRAPRSLLVRNLVGGTSEVLKSSAMGRRIHSLLSSLGVHNLARRLIELNMKEGARVPLDPKLRARLTADYEEEIARLEEITGRDLASWRTPR